MDCLIIDRANDKFLLRGSSLLPKAVSNYKRTSRTLKVLDRSGDVAAFVTFRTFHPPASYDARENFHSRQTKYTYISTALAVLHFFTPSKWLAIGCTTLVVAGSVSIFQKADFKLRVRSELSGELVMAAITVYSLCLGEFVGASIANWFYHIREWSLAKTERRTQSEILGLSDKLSPNVIRLIAGEETTTRLEDVIKGDLILVHAGESCPVDGSVETGFALVDKRHITGDSKLVEVQPGDRVLSSSVLTRGNLTIRAECDATDSIVAQIDQLYSNTDHYLNRHALNDYERISDGFALPAFVSSVFSYFTNGLAGSLSTLNSWPVCGIVVVGATGMLRHISIGASNGFLVKDARIFSEFSKIDRVIFDKTGTLTEGDPVIVNMVTVPEYGEDEIIRFAAIAESGINHPLATALINEAHKRGIVPPRSDDRQVDLGLGVSAQCGKYEILVGNRRFILSKSIQLDPFFETAANEAQSRNSTISFVVINRRVISMIEFGAKLRPDAFLIIEEFKRFGVDKFSLLSGDGEQSTEQISEQLHISHYKANALPHEKAEYIRSFQETGENICYIGDGLNDALALKQANVSIALNNGSAAAQNSADLVMADFSHESIKYFIQIVESYRKSKILSLTGTCLPLVVSLIGSLIYKIPYLTTVFLSYSGIGLGLLIASSSRAPQRNLELNEPKLLPD